MTQKLFEQEISNLKKHIIPVYPALKVVYIFLQEQCNNQIKRIIRTKLHK